MTYSIREVFDTFQGEGLRAGTRAVFIRFTGCNMWDGNPEHRDRGAGACARWCDTDFMPRRGQKMSAHEIANKVEELWPEQAGHPQRWVVLTGGEPLLQVDQELHHVLCDYGFKVAVETNGTVAPKTSLPFDHLCVSPKLKADGSLPDLQIWKAHELKIVLPGAVDVGGGWRDWQLNEVATMGEWGAMFVQPMDPTAPDTVEISHLRGGYFKPDLLQAAVDQCLRWVREHPEWRLGVQLHKVLNLP